MELTTVASSLLGKDRIYVLIMDYGILNSYSYRNLISRFAFTFQICLFLISKM